MGAFNTGILIGSSLTMALAVRCAQKGEKNSIIGWLIATIVLGFGFLGVKYFEYSHKWHDNLVLVPLLFGKNLAIWMWQAGK